MQWTDTLVTRPHSATSYCLCGNGGGEKGALHFSPNSCAAREMQRHGLTQGAQLSTYLHTASFPGLPCFHSSVWVDNNAWKRKSWKGGEGWEDSSHD